MIFLIIFPYYKSVVWMATDDSYYFTDTLRCRVRHVSVTGIITTFAGNGLSLPDGDGGLASMASFVSPSGVAGDTNGNMYITDVGVAVVRKVTAGTNIIQTIAGEFFLRF